MNPYQQFGHGQVGDVFRYAHELTERLSEEERRERQRRTARRAMLLRQDTTDWLVVNSLGIDPALYALHRYLPSEIYVDTSEDQGEESYEIARAFGDLLEAAGFEPFDDSIPEFGSMRWRRVHRTKYRKTASQLNDRLTLLQLALTTSFKKAGMQVDDEPADRAEMERVEALHRAELRKIEAETEQAKAEAKKAGAEATQARAEALKALSETADTFVKAIRKAAVTFAIVFGTLHMWGHPTTGTTDPKPTVEFKINSHKFNSGDTREISGSVWVHLPQRQTSESAQSEENEGHDPLDAE